MENKELASNRRSTAQAFWQGMGMLGQMWPEPRSKRLNTPFEGVAKAFKGVGDSLRLVMSQLDREIVSDGK